MKSEQEAEVVSDVPLGPASSRPERSVARPAPPCETVAGFMPEALGWNLGTAFLAAISQDFLGMAFALVAGLSGHAAQFSPANTSLEHRCATPGAWRHVSTDASTECNVESIGLLLTSMFDTLGNRSASPDASRLYVERLLEDLAGLTELRTNATVVAPRRRLRGLPGGSRPLAPLAPEGDWIDWTGSHPAREYDATMYNTYRQVCAFWRHFSEIMLVPEGIIGIVFGFWWMNMMTMKTCFICSKEMPRANDPPDDSKGCPSDAPPANSPFGDPNKK